MKNVSAVNLAGKIRDFFASVRQMHLLGRVKPTWGFQGRS